DAFGELAEAVLVSEERVQLVGQLGVSVQQLLAIRRLAETLRFQVIGENLVHPALAFTDRTLVGHGSLAFSLRRSSSVDDAIHANFGREAGDFPTANLMTTRFR